MPKTTKKKAPSKPAKKTASKTASKTTSKTTSKPASKTTSKATSKATSKPIVGEKSRPVVASAERGSVKATLAKTVARPSNGLIEVGAAAPPFTLQNAAGKSVSLADFVGSGANTKPVVLYFYPQDDTPGCTVEACAFRDNRPKFAKLSCTILGVSPDSPESHRAFDAKFKLGLTLLADTPGADGVPPLAAKYGVWQEKNMYGKKYMGIVRTTYVIAPNGTIAARFDRVKVDGHAEAVLAAVASIGA